MKKKKFKSKFKKSLKSLHHSKIQFIKRSIPSIPRIKLIGNSRVDLKNPPLMRLPVKNTPNFKNNFDSICQKRYNRRLALFKTGKAGKIKVREAKWTLKSLIRCR